MMVDPSGSHSIADRKMSRILILSLIIPKKNEVETLIGAKCNFINVWNKLLRCADT
jgi:hypothetical protein